MICDRVAIIVGGRVISQGALHDLISEKVLFTEATLSGFAPEDLAGFGGAGLRPGRPDFPQDL